MNFFLSVLRGWFTCGCPTFLTPLAERLFFPIVYCCLLCRRLIVLSSVGLFLGSLFCFTDLFKVHSNFPSQIFSEHTSRSRHICLFLKSLVYTVALECPNSASPLPNPHSACFFSSLALGDLNCNLLPQMSVGDSFFSQWAMAATFVVWVSSELGTEMKGLHHLSGPPHTRWNRPTWWLVSEVVFASSRTRENVGQV